MTGKIIKTLRSQAKVLEDLGGYYVSISKTAVPVQGKPWGRSWDGALDALSYGIRPWESF
jgi:hypothetical protein